MSQWETRRRTAQIEGKCHGTVQLTKQQEENKSLLRLLSIQPRLLSLFSLPASVSPLSHIAFPFSGVSSTLLSACPSGHTRGHQTNVCPAALFNSFCLSRMHIPIIFKLMAICCLCLRIYTCVFAMHLQMLANTHTHVCMCVRFLWKT